MVEKNEQRVIFSFMDGMIFPVKTILTHCKDFFILAVVVSLVAAVFNVLLGRGIACSFGLEGVGFYCLNHLWSGLTTAGVLFYLSAYFINRWWNIAFYEVGACRALKDICWQKDLKVFWFELFYAGVFFVAGGGIYWLKMRIATPNLGLELLLFVVMSVVIMGAVFAIFNMVLFARFLDGKRWFVLKETFWPVFDNIYKIFAWFVLYLLIFIGLLKEVVLLFLDSQVFLPLWLGNFLGEFLLQFILCIMLSCLISSLKYQEGVLFQEDD